MSVGVYSQVRIVRITCETCGDKFDNYVKGTGTKKRFCERCVRKRRNEKACKNR